MGSCTSGLKKKSKVEERNSPDEKSNSNKPNEDVTYASINHSTSKGSRRTRVNTDDDCDYAIVNVPAAPPPDADSECSSKEDCADDYVLMG